MVAAEWSDAFDSTPAERRVELALSFHGTTCCKCQWLLTQLIVRLKVLFACLSLSGLHIENYYFPFFCFYYSLM